MPVLLALALFNPQDHTLTVYVTDLEIHHFADPEARPIGDREGGFVLEAGCCLQQATDLIPAEHLGQPLRCRLGT